MDKNTMTEIEELKSLLLQRQAQLDTLTAELDSVYKSRSWRITRPLRFLGDTARKTKGKFRRKKIIVANGKMGVSWKRRRGFRIDPAAFGCTEETLVWQKSFVFPREVKFSVLVPLYNTPENFLREMIASVLFQTYGNWELCLADGSDAEHAYVQEICEKIAGKDRRIKYKKLDRNGGISENTNECAKMATGDYISLFDHDDLLHPSALFETMRAVCERDAEFVYTDEAIFESPNLHKIICTNFKPDFAPDYFQTNNYICHFSSFKRSLFDEVGGFDPRTDGAQDYDLFLRLSEVTSRIIHVPKCLYYWRASPSSTAGDAGNKGYTSAAGQRALQGHFARLGVDAEVLLKKEANRYRIRYGIEGSPLVSIMIPNCDHAPTLRKCVDSIMRLSTWQNYEIVIIENNSRERETFDYYESLKSCDKIRVVKWEGEFNYSAINNFGFKHTKGEHIILLNNDTEVIAHGWIEEMLMFAQRKDVGAVGAMLYYPSGRIQHGGVILGLGGIAGHAFLNFRKGDAGCVDRLLVVNNYSAVTAACVMIPRHVYEEIDGLDEGFAVAFNDVDMCMRIRRAGYLVVWTPYAELYHHESESRGYDDTPEKKARFAGEIARFQSRWGSELAAGDPYYNPNLTLDKWDFSLSPEGTAFPGGFHTQPVSPCKRIRWPEKKVGFPHYIDSWQKSVWGLSIAGWAYLEDNDCDVYVRAGDLFYKADKIERPDVQDAFGLSHNKVGFSIMIPSDAADLRLLLVNRTKKEIYVMENTEKLQ